MGGGGGDREECRCYIDNLPLPGKVRTALPLLMKPLSVEVVEAALDSMEGGSSAGADGMPSELYQRFPAVFVPRMQLAMLYFLG